MENNEIDVVAIMRNIQNEAEEKFAEKEQKLKKEKMVTLYQNRKRIIDSEMSDIRQEMEQLNHEIVAACNDISVDTNNVKSRGLVGEKIPTYEWKNAFSRKISILVAKVVRKFTRHITTEQREVYEELTKAIEVLQVNQLKLLNKINDVSILVERLEEKEEFSERLSIENSKGSGENSAQKENMSSVELDDDVYLRFENKYRGSEHDIKARMIYYIEHHITGKITPEQEGLVVDLGCGRGEWLELLREKGFLGIGIDTNEDMVLKAKDKQIDAVCIDAISYLKSLKSDSVKLLTCFQVIEHISTNQLIQLMEELGRVVKKGGMIILETPNPENLRVGACNFYLDPTHKRPVHPEFLKFLAEENGFETTDFAYWKQEQEERWWSGVVSEDQTQIFDSTSFRTVSEAVKQSLYNSPDYALVAIK